MATNPLPKGTPQEFLGLGFYSVGDAAQLLKMPARNIRRWLGGYNFRENGELTFRDLIELRFVNAFAEAGVGLKAIRNCLELAREVVGNDRPFSTSRFRTDGRTIFLDSIVKSGDEQLLDLKKRQFGFKPLIERSFKDLDLEDDEVSRWRPFKGRSTIVVDPERSFGQPIISDGVPTVALADAVKAEGTAARVAALYEVPLASVRDAVQFESELRAA
jgi:uncharacterized protein (DUF433 family)/DNA-binding transcriptional MerR regulator